ncbi:MAG: hydroxymethylglutaryl-CoA lyase [Phycisphaerae bacterium]|nr:hydroxymethylglutaryl-CoA lyase [Phycisphaerae bacterium]
MPDRVRITDVSPRDGLQNEPGTIPTAHKARLVRALDASGVDEIEVTSFVSAKWLPQLGDAAELLGMLAATKPPGIVYSALVPNEQGMRAAIEVNERAARRVVDKVAVFTAASETFSKRNTNATIAETLRRFDPVIALARGKGLLVRGYISCAVECPFEGRIAPERVAHVAQALFDMGVDELDLGDTIGAAEPETINLLLHAIASRLGDRLWPMTTLHLHDTFGRAAECVREALQLGVRSFDGAVSGLGGCPYASTPGRRAPGNIDTERLVRVVLESGYSTGVNLDGLARAASVARSLPGMGGGAG